MALVALTAAPALATTQKRKVSDPDQLSPYAKRVPATPKTGNKLIDQQALTQRLLLQQVISDCQRDGGNIAVAQAAIRERAQHLASQAVTMNADVFKSFGTLRRLDDDFKIDFIVSETGLNQKQVSTLYDKKAEDINYIITYITQIRLDQKLPDMLAAKPVCRMFLKERIAICARTLHVIPGILKADGTLERFKLACYTPKYDATGLCVALTHASGAVQPITKSFLKRGEFAFVDGNDDMSCGIKYADIPVMRISDMWVDKAAGPFAIQQFAGTKCQAKLVMAVKLVYDQWVATTQTLTGAGAAASQSKAIVEKVKTAKAKASAQKGRAAAKVKFAEKATDRIIKLD
jgi:hypothetical protein